MRDVHAPKDIFVLTPAEYREQATSVSGIVREAIDRGEGLHEGA